MPSICCIPTRMLGVHMLKPAVAAQALLAGYTEPNLRHSLRCSCPRQGCSRQQVATCTWQVHKSKDESIIVHMDVQETKEPGGIGNHLRLGTPLHVIGPSAKPKDAYEDLDELIARFAEPYIASYRALTSHRYGPLLPLDACLTRPCLPMPPGCPTRVLVLHAKLAGLREATLLSRTSMSCVQPAKQQ